MRMSPSHGAARRASTPAAACTLVLSLLLPGQVGASAGEHARQGAGAAQLDSATLEQCVTAVDQVERSATFAGEMQAIPGSARMAMRFEVEERVAGEEFFHRVVAPGLGVWRAADPKVKIYKYVKQVTNLSSPAEYRALVRFRWETAGARVIKRAERFTPRCVQPEAPPSAASTPPATTS
jgi:hypothetical protein